MSRNDVVQSANCSTVPQLCCWRNVYIRPRGYTYVRLVLLSDFRIQRPASLRSHRITRSRSLQAIKLININCYHKKWVYASAGGKKWRGRLRQTGSEIDKYVEQQNGVGADIEDHPARTEVVVEKWYCDRQNDEVGHEQNQHTQVPVESTRRHSVTRSSATAEIARDANLWNGHSRSLKVIRCCANCQSTRHVWLSISIQ